MELTQPIFILGSGRSGTRMMYKLFAGLEGVESHHEYLCTHIQKYAIMYSMKLIDKAAIKEKIQALHGAAIYYSNSHIWIDASNKLSWIIEPLYELFPNAKFINLIRDGRKVVASYYFKLSNEIYDDKSSQIMLKWLRQGGVMPPPEKKYWWRFPIKGEPFYEEFSHFNQIQRISYQWAKSYETIENSLKKIPEENYFEVKLEALKDQSVFRKMLNFMGIDYSDELWEYLQTPQGVIMPINFKLNKKQMTQFYEIAGDMMKALGYEDQPIYDLRY